MAMSIRDRIAASRRAKETPATTTGDWHRPLYGYVPGEEPAGGTYKADTGTNPYLAMYEATTGGPADDQGNPMLETLRTLLTVFVLIVLLRAFVGEPYQVPSGSMLETIQLGDRLFGEKVSYRFRDPVAGEIVTFTDPDPTRGGVTLIKRVIATEGQTVDLRDGVVYVDGLPLDEPYTQGKQTQSIAGHGANLEEDISYPYVVPDGCVWVMGDNRTNSLDSRYFGAVDVDNVSSRAVFIFWPPEDAGLF